MTSDKMENERYKPRKGIPNREEILGEAEETAIESKKRIKGAKESSQ